MKPPAGDYVFNRTVEALRANPPAPRRRWRSARGFLAGAVVVGVGAFASQAMGREATPAEVRVVRDAALHLSAVGVATSVPRVVVMEGDECGWIGFYGRPPYACALPDAVVLSPFAAVEAGRYARMVARTSRRGRQAAFVACLDSCVWAMTNALHELVHVHRLRVLDGWPLEQVAREEGLAQAVAEDQVCPMSFRVTGAAICDDAVTSYEAEVNAVRAEAARAVGGAWWSASARRWRLNMIGG